MITIEELNTKLQELGQMYWQRIKLLEIEDQTLLKLATQISLINELLQNATRKLSLEVENNE